MQKETLNNLITLFATALLSGAVGFVAGDILSENGTPLRGWISALSGWVAGGAALYVGLVTLRPIARQAQLQEASYTAEASDIFLRLKRESDDWLIAVNAAKEIFNAAQKGEFFVTSEIPLVFTPFPRTNCEPEANDIIIAFDDVGDKVRAAINSIGRATFPGTRSPDLPKLASDIEKRLKRLNAFCSGVPSFIEVNRKVGGNPSDGDKDAWRKILTDLATKYYRLVVDESSEDIAQMIIAYRRLLDKEIERHR